MNPTQKKFNHQKYQAFPTIRMDKRQWPDNIMRHAPQWCSVDLRDGNQALVNPLSVQQKLKLFKILVAIGFKEIEVGFPSASQDDFVFVQTLINDNYIPDDVTIAVLTPAREDFIKRTFKALTGAKKALVHLYNSTSKVQREKVFNMDKSGITQIAVRGAKLMQKCANAQTETQWQFQYSPESFSGTELNYAVEICNAVIDVWQPDSENPAILNLPSTVEMSMPNIYADQIEWFCHHINKRDSIIISVHTHNDRGCAVAAAEMAVLAGAERVEGTLLGNGERTGNMDIITMAMNCYSQGIDPQLDLSDIRTHSENTSCLIDIPIHPRHPYIGDLVYSAFSGSHQDAISKCLKSYKTGDKWDVAYLPIDPADLGHSYQAVIRINSQSGKGGIAYIIEQALATQIPRWLQLEFSQKVQQQTEQSGSELPAVELVDLFKKNYLISKNILQINSYQTIEDISIFNMTYSGRQMNIQAGGVGILDAFISALSEYFGLAINIIEYNEQTLQPDSSARAIAFVSLQLAEKYFSGAAENEDIVLASLNAILQAISEYLTDDAIKKVV
ncbi:MAG: 2-isopropylmalate synthase [gamma proteobacterium symbiont of Taylorina sp.]|nr:2-isopropylmalate synthase [gamma proteobacterium symbiont of Taylorina sp.]